MPPRHSTSTGSSVVTIWRLTPGETRAKTPGRKAYSSPSARSVAAPERQTYTSSCPVVPSSCSGWPSECAGQRSTLIPNDETPSALRTGTNTP